jgi:hypothetical protein
MSSFLVYCLDVQADRVSIAIVLCSCYALCKPAQSKCREAKHRAKQRAKLVGQWQTRETAQEIGFILIYVFLLFQRFFGVYSVRGIGSQTQPQHPLKLSPGPCFVVLFPGGRLLDSPTNFSPFSWTLFPFVSTRSSQPIRLGQFRPSMSIEPIASPTSIKTYKTPVLQGMNFDR